MERCAPEGILLVDIHPRVHKGPVLCEYFYPRTLGLEAGSIDPRDHFRKSSFKEVAQDKPNQIFSLPPWLYSEHKSNPEVRRQL